MKILTCADIHENMSSLCKLEKSALKEKVDVVVCAGDFTNFNKHLLEILRIFERFPCKVIVIHGNHESEEELEVAVKHLKNVFFIHKKILKISNFTFVGYGGGGFSVKDLKLEQFANNLKVDWKKTILITHAPPKYTTTDFIPGVGHVGNETLVSIIHKYQPALVVCGHIEEAGKKQDMIGKTRIINPGPNGVLIELC